MVKNSKKAAKTNKKDSGESEAYKKFKKSPGLYIGSVVILILVLVAFLGGDLISQKSDVWDGIFGYYDKIPIRWAPDNVLDQYRKEAIQRFQYYGEDMSNPENIARVWQQAFEGAVVHNALLQVMRRSNYVVPEKTINARIVQHPDLLENGKFSPVRYNRMSKSDQLNLRRQTEESITKGVYFNDFFDGLLMTNAEAEFIGSMATPERTFAAIYFNIDNYPESEYISYAEENSKLFDTLHLSRITVTSGEREAKRILDSINSGAISFEEAARTQSNDNSADRGGDMGSCYYYELDREVPSEEAREVIYNLRRGEISSVLRVQDSWVIYRLEDDIKKPNFEDEAVLETVRSYVRRYDRGKMEDWTIAQAASFASAANESSFEEAARGMNLAIQSLGPFPINYSGIDLFSGIQSNPVPGFSDRELSDLSRNENFWKIAFSTGLNKSSEPFVQGNKVIVLCPKVETINEDAAVNAASTFLSTWLNSRTEQAIPYYFINSPRMDDRFIDTYIKELM